MSRYLSPGHRVIVTSNYGQHALGGQHSRPIHASADILARTALMALLATMPLLSAGVAIPFSVVLVVGVVRRRLHAPRVPLKAVGSCALRILACLAHELAG